MAAILVAWTAVAFAQPLPPTRAFSPPDRTIEDPAKKVVQDKTGDLTLDTQSSPRELIEDVVDGVRFLRGSTPHVEQRACIGSVERRLRRAVVDLSVADNAYEWAHALTSAIGAMDAIGGSASADTKTEPCDVTSPVGEDSSVETLRRISAYRNALYRHYKLGPPAGLPHSGRAAHYLPAAGIAAGKTSPEVKIQISDLFFSNHWRLYLRSTLQPTEQAPDDAEEADDAQEGEEAAAEDLKDDKVRSALLDPFGGVFYATTGYFRKIRTPFLTGAANDAEHGLFFDGRAGLKIVELPEEDIALADGKTRVTPFWTTSATGRLRLPVYKGSMAGSRAGVVEFALTATSTRIGDTDASGLFRSIDGATPNLPRTTSSAHFSVALALTELANVAVSGTLWSNTKFEKRIVVEVNLVRPQDDTPPSKESARGSR